jgi:hypothetical protein
MAPRPPSDAIVALRSLGRRYRALFAGLGEDEAPDDMAHRVGAQGHSAFDHMAAASRTLTTTGRALDHVLVEDDPVLDPMSTRTSEREAEQQPGGTVEERLSELEIDANRLADRASRTSARDWGRSGRLDDGFTVTAADLLWSAVDAAIEHLKSAGQILDEVRGRP